jgi:Protein of unknown function (DUF3015)
MSIYMRVTWGLVSAVVVVVTLSACTLKASSEASSDATTDFVSSTSDRGWLTQDGLIKAEHKVQAFATVNFENLRQDMAQGHGEYLASLWALLGGTADQAPAFYTRTQVAYPLLLSAQQTTPEEMLVTLARVLSAPPTMNTPR